MNPQRTYTLAQRIRAFSYLSTLCALSIGASAVAGATSESGAAPQEAMDQAWWTGPLLAANAATLPQGHWLLEPYVFDLMTYGQFDSNGTLRSTGAAHTIGSQGYIEYGVVDRFTLGLIPRLGFHESSAEQESSGFTVGDITLQGAYGLTQFRPGSWIPSTSLVIGETFPTGKYDRLDGQTDGALGSGAYSTTLSLYSQTYFWMPSGRILRTRLDLSYEVSRWASVHGMSVYGTFGGFTGRAHPGQSFVTDLAFEYSVTQNWVLASDIWWEHDGNTRLVGDYVPSLTSALPSYLVENSGSDDLLYLAPAIEYNWSARVGVIAGVRIAALGRNTAATVTPVAAVNMVF
ncbi:MAG: transporter [Steroidobacteraceae bacterium]